jgi:DeoR/GlpR family transcriptional regulator of sugar metabolism
VQDGSTIALSSGTTVLEMARLLRHRRLTVITNALDVATVLLDADEVELIVLGGVVLPQMHSMRGHLTEDTLRDLRADTVFMGASAIDLGTGFMTEQVREIAVDRAMRSIAREAVILADSSKFDRVAPGFMFGFEQVGTVVTDDHIDSRMHEALEQRGLRVVVGSSDV